MPRIRRYVAIDGGAGAHVLAALRAEGSVLQSVASPRHADLLIVVGPLSAKLAPAVFAYARALPLPAQAIVIDAPVGSPSLLDPTPITDLLPGALHLDGRTTAPIVHVVRHHVAWPELRLAAHPDFTETTIALPNKQRELATELAVYSLGPLQSLTAGPLRLLLICDGEQVLQAEVEAGYVQRGIAEAMARTTWQEAAELATVLDPLAPIAGRLAYVQALEHVQQQPAPAAGQKARQVALAVERTVNHLWWLQRFLDFLAAPEPAAQAGRCAAVVAQLAGQLWREPPTTWLTPQGAAPALLSSALPASRQAAADVRALARRLSGMRLLRLRLRGIGVLPVEALRQAGATGPVRQAAEHGTGDAWSRLLVRLTAARDNLEVAATALSTAGTAEGKVVRPQASTWHTGAGAADVTVEGPRGPLGLHIVSDGGDGPAQVAWRRPSAVLLTLLPSVLAHQKLVDAETLVASLDLAMAEADG